MLKYEYRVLFGDDYNQFTTDLNKLGSQGFRYISIPADSGCWKYNAVMEKVVKEEI